MLPELPMQLMQPNPQVEAQLGKGLEEAGALEHERGGVAAGGEDLLDPGLGRARAPRRCLARRPAATIMAGSVAVVQLVMAAMAMAPWRSVTSSSPKRERGRLVGHGPLPCSASEERKRSLRPAGVTRAWGREGPARLVSTSERSSSTVRE
jgi:hypothetical protein